MGLRNGVIGIIYRKGKDDARFLILHRCKDWRGWEFSKGGVEPGETEEKAVLREIKEETGLKDVKIRSRVPYEISYNYPEGHSEKYRGARQSVFLVESFSGSVMLSEEHDNSKWVDYESALKILKHEGQKKALSKSMNVLL